jgi:probable addiction module antidote protein
MAKESKIKSSSFQDHLLQNLKEDDQLVFLHIKEALEDPDLNEKNDYAYLVKAIGDVALARGKTELAEKAGLSRQGLHKILNGESVPNIQNIMAILKAIGLRFSVEQVEEVIGNEIPANVLDVAEYAASLLSRESTYMKLQKIVYYAQVESLVHYKKPLFAEKIQAWRGGPVVKELFDKHQKNKFLTTIKLGNIENLTVEQKACINWAVDKYGMLDGDTLSHITHLEDPWNHARGTLPPEAPSDAEITIDAMTKYYSNLPKYRELEEQDETQSGRQRKK